MLTDKDIQAFKKVYLEDYGLEMTDAEVVEATTKALTLIERVMRPLPGEIEEQETAGKTEAEGFSA